MDFTSFFGLAFGIAMILGGQALEGGHASSIVNLPAAMIVLGGTFGCVLMGSPGKDALRAFLNLRYVFFKPKLIDPQSAKDLLSEMARIARRDGLLALEEAVENIESSFFKSGVRHIVDGLDSALVREIMENDIDHREQEMMTSVSFWEAAGGFAPTIGIVGAVLGLIHTMQNLDDPSKIGGGIASAFVATVYGVAIANMLFLPIAGKLRRRISQIMDADRMIMEGLIAVQAGHNAHVLEALFEVYIEEGDTKAEATETRSASAGT